MHDRRISTGGQRWACVTGGVNQDSRSTFCTRECQDNKTRTPGPRKCRNGETKVENWRPEPDQRRLHARVRSMMFKRLGGVVMLLRDAKVVPTVLAGWQRIAGEWEWKSVDSSKEPGSPPSSALDWTGCCNWTWLPSAIGLPWGTLPCSVGAAPRKTGFVRCDCGSNCS